MAVSLIIAVNSKFLGKMFLMLGVIFIILIKINIFNYLCFPDPDLISLSLDA